MHNFCNDDAGIYAHQKPSSSACSYEWPSNNEFPEQFVIIACEALECWLQSIKFKLCPIVLQLRSPSVCVALSGR